MNVFSTPAKDAIEKMNQTLRTVNSILKPIERTTTSFIPDQY